MTKTQIPLTVKMEIQHADDKNSGIKAVCSIKQETYIEVDVPENIMNVFKALTWGSNQLVITVEGGRGFPKPELVASEPEKL